MTFTIKAECILVDKPIPIRLGINIWFEKVANTKGSFSGDFKRFPSSQHNSRQSSKNFANSTKTLIEFGLKSGSSIDKEIWNSPEKWVGISTSTATQNLPNWWTSGLCKKFLRSNKVWATHVMSLLSYTTQQSLKKRIKAQPLFLKRTQRHCLVFRIKTSKSWKSGKTLQPDDVGRSHNTAPGRERRLKVGRQSLKVLTTRLEPQFRRSV